MQKNWIGRSEVAYFDFPLEGQRDSAVRVFTTRPETLFDATYIAVAPDHELVSQLKVVAG